MLCACAGCPLDTVLGENRLDLVPQWLVDDGGVLSRICPTLVGDLAPVNAVLQHQIERATGDLLATIRGAVGPNPSFAPDQGSFEPGFGCTIADAVVGSCSAYPFFLKKMVTTGRGDKIEVRDGGFVANNPTLYAIADATESMCHARDSVRVVSIGVGEYPPPTLPATSARKWFSKLPTVKFAQRLLEINTQSMDELRRALFRGVKTVRINTKYTEPEMATDMLEADMNKLGKLWSRGRDSARECEAELKEFLT